MAPFWSLLHSFEANYCLKENENTFLKFKDVLLCKSEFPMNPQKIDAFVTSPSYKAAINNYLRLTIIL